MTVYRASLTKRARASNAEMAERREVLVQLVQTAGGAA